MTTAAPPSPAPAPARPLPLASATVHSTLPLAARYFAVSAAFLVAGSVGLVWIAPYLAAGLFPAPQVAGVTHLFTLGWLTLTIFGAMAQISPMALGAPVRSVRWAHVAFWVLPPSIALFAYGVATSSMNATSIGVGGVAVGIALNVGNFGASLTRARTRDVTWAGLVIGLAFLASTLVLGMVLAHNLHYGSLAAARARVLSAHLHVAIVGWVLVVIVGVSNRMLPMFLIARGATATWSRRSVALLTAGVPVLAFGLADGWPAVTWTGAALVEAGVCAFLWQAWTFIRIRTRRALDSGMRFAAAGLAYLIVAAVLGPLALVYGAAAPRLATAYVATALLGALTLYVVGHYYRVASMLVWSLRFAGHAGRGPVRAATDLYSARLVHVQLACMAGGVALVVAGIGAASPALARAGASAVLAGSLVMAYQLIRMRWNPPGSHSNPVPHP